MNHIHQNKDFHSAEDKAIQDLKKWFMLCLDHWKWIGLSVFLGCAIALGVNFWEPLIWDVTTEIVKKSESKSSSSDIASLIPLEGMQFSKVNLEYEKRLFTATELLTKVIEDNNYNLTYYKKEDIRTREMYKNTPFEVFYTNKSSLVPYGIRFEIEKIDTDQFQLILDDEEWTPLFEGQVLTFGKLYTLNGFEFRINNTQNDWEEGTQYYFQLTSTQDLIYSLRESIKVSVLGEKNTEIPLIQLKLSGNIPQKQIDILRYVVEEVQLQDIKEKNQKNIQTSEFVESQLTTLQDSMQLLATQIHQLKTNRAELTGGTTAIFEKIYKLNEEKSKLQLGLKYTDYLLAQAENGFEDKILMPEAYGIDGAQLSQLLQKFSELRLELSLDNQRLKRSILYKEELAEKENALVVLKKDIAMAIQGTESAVKLQLEQVNEELGSLMQSTSSLLSEEKVLMDYQRLFQTHEALHTLLLQKKAEFNIRSAGVVSDYSYVSPPEKGKLPIGPKKALNLLIGLIIGGILPLGFFYIRVLFDLKVRDESDIADITDLPFLGKVADPKEGEKLVAKHKIRSIEAETYRNIRSNLQFFVGEKERFKMLVTSSISGEGKSLFASNIACFYAQLNKKVLLIEADLRKPGLKQYLPEAMLTPGLSSFLIGKNSINDIIHSTSIENLWMVPSGVIPPNPSELLHADRMNELLELTAENYDVVIIDGAPSGLVADSYNIMKQVDLVTYLARHAYTPKEFLKDSLKKLSPELHKKTVMLLTGISLKSNRYGNGQYAYYGAEYTMEKK